MGRIRHYLERGYFIFHWQNGRKPKGDYSDAYTAQFVIEKDRVFTKNSNLPHGHGELQLNKFEPFPKNPPISKVFREIGYADELGSGMRNTNKYTKLYSGETPVFIEGNIFEINKEIKKRTKK